MTERYTQWDVLAEHHNTTRRNKVILVMDEPMDCDHCPLHDLSSMRGDWICLPTDKWIETQNDHRKPEWCPLKDMPLKKNTDFCRNIPYANGWNDCIEEIREAKNESNTDS